MPDTPNGTPGLPSAEDVQSWLKDGEFPLGTLGFALAALIVLWIVVRMMAARRMRRRPVRLHPRLRKYGGPFGEGDEELAGKRTAEAARIVATSSTDAIMGYEIVEQVEAVFVDGFRRPEEALQGLKAVAAMKGANAVTNVRQERAASGDCCVSGDAVVVRKHGPAPGETDSARTRSTQEQVQEHGSPE